MVRGAGAMKQRPFIYMHIPIYNPDIQNMDYHLEYYYLVVQRDKH